MTAPNRSPFAALSLERFLFLKRRGFEPQTDSRLIEIIIESARFAKKLREDAIARGETIVYDDGESFFTESAKKPEEA